MAECVKFLNEIARPRSIDADEAFFFEERRERIERDNVACIFSAPIPKEHAPLTGCERFQKGGFPASASADNPGDGAAVHEVNTLPATGRP